MWKAILAGSTALAIAGSTFVYAQQRPGGPDGAQRWRPGIEDMRAFGEARLAGLKAGLLLTAEQEKNWPAFEQASREFAKQRLDRIGAFMNARRDRQAPVADPSERMRRRATVMSETGAALKKLADATDPLYKSLDDGQKRRFAILSRMGERRGHGGREFRGRDGGPRGFDRQQYRTELGPEESERSPSLERGRRGGQRGGQTL